MARRLAPSVNAGSMADIAFLLLIFFLVTTTIRTEQGIRKKLPPPNDDPIDTVIKEKNVFEVAINQDNELLVEGKLLELKDLKGAAIAFLDNGGQHTCSYCKGAQDKTSSDHPDRAIVSLVSDRESSYETYVSVQDELLAAYEKLRDRESKRLYGITYKALKQRLKDAGSDVEKEKPKEQIEKIKSMYPEKLSEGEPIR